MCNSFKKQLLMPENTFSLNLINSSSSYTPFTITSSHRYLAKGSVRLILPSSDKPSSYTPKLRDC
eukprot:gnl/Chilomastix_caulleri/7112.p1 GENE.gnl/Chilomastix_caulleri/7112~~gnl/Chilomastix_caulleri/7112.p1  ORF type:complete len:65 (+),score=7.90 gnl/Chilomastix_caulleri/7112:46-240(+)